MHTQTDIEHVIEGSSHLSAERKEKLLALLPDLYVKIEQSMLLEDQLGEDLLLLLPYLSDEQIEGCMEAFKNEHETLSDVIEKIVDAGGASLNDEAESLVTEGEALLKTNQRVLVESGELDDLDILEDQINAI